MTRPAVPSTTVDVVCCPECDGDGYHLYTGGPGRFDSAFGNWLPTERHVLCDACGGVGEIELDPADQDYIEDDLGLIDEELPF